MTTFLENTDKETVHMPVMLDEIVEYLRPERGGRFVDCTVGLGGHSAALLRASADVRLVAIDRDSETLDLARERLREFGDRVMFVHDDYRRLGDVLDRLGIERVTGILADFGVSSRQLDTPGRGFSFRFDGPLDMRMDQTQGPTAAELVNTLSVEALANLIFEFGEERASRRIARAIDAARSDGPIETTERLAGIIRRVLPHQGKQRIDPATRTFQALRIAVNRELDGLDAFVTAAVGRLESEGRLAVVTFHSLEDRPVKWAMRREAGWTDSNERDLYGKPVHVGDIRRRALILTRKPTVASEREQQTNPRSRSAKLRVCERIDEDDPSSL